MEGVQEGGGMVFEGVSEMVGDVGLRCANPTLRTSLSSTVFP